MSTLSSSNGLGEPVSFSGSAACQDPAFEKLLFQFRTGTPEEGVRAAESLRSYGERAVVPLCDALASPHPEVRAAVADTLGEIGDERAIHPLTDALLAEHGGQSPRLYLWIGVAVAIGIVVLVGSLLYGLLFLKIGGGMAWVGSPLSKKFRERRQRDRASAGARTNIIRALTRVAERHTAPELMRLVPDLKAIAADSLRQQQETRAASREAAERITRLTERLRALPVAVQQAPVRPDELPRPAGTPEPDTAVLPRSSPSAD